MNERVTREERLQSPGEEIANSVSAGAGLIAAIAGIPLLLAFATQRGSNWTVAGALVFAATTVWLYLASTMRELRLHLSVAIRVRKQSTQGDTFKTLPRTD